MFDNSTLTENAHQCATLTSLVKAIQALKQMGTDQLECRVVVGGSNPHREILRNVIQGLRFPLSIEENVVNMPDLMAWADLAISASGSTCWELLFMGLPALLFILADNQQLIAESHEKEKIMVPLGWHANISAHETSKKIEDFFVHPSSYFEMTRKGQKLVDGQGSARVAQTML